MQSKSYVKPKCLEDYVNEVSYDFLNNKYVPSSSALQFINFIKLVNGSKPEENKTPVIHLHMIDSLLEEDNSLFVVFRGAAKTTVLHEYMFLYIAVYGTFFNFGEVNVAMYISDTMENGVKNMRQQLEHRWENSAFLQRYIPKIKFTDDKWEFTNADGKRFFVRGFAAMTGVRGFKKYGERPTWCGFDDLMSDKNSKSPTILSDIEDVVYKGARQAMHPTKRKVIWTGTPFSQKDSLYKAAGSTGWATKAYPVCETFPCTKEEFKGAWEDRFTYEGLVKEYEILKSLGKVADFNQELMLRIMSEDDRLILDTDIQWYTRSTILKNKGAYNFYITTDFATSAENANDFSVISVWALNHQGYWFWVDGIVKRQLMDVNIKDLFRLAQKYKPVSVGIEVSGQQGGFIPWIQAEMGERNCYFSIASENNNNKPGIKPNTNKMVRFNVVVPWFKAKKIFFPTEMEHSSEIIEFINELSLASPGAFKAKHDDCIDTISMLSCLPAYRPSEEIPVHENENGVWEEDEQEDNVSSLQSYVV